MKKIFLTFSLLLSAIAFSQVSTLVINNYTTYKLTGRLRAADLTNCVPELYMGNILSSGNFTIPASSSTEYSKYYTANTATVPVFDYLVRMSNTTPASVLPYNHPNVLAISPTTDWSFFAFDVRDASNNVLDHFEIGVAPCAGNYPTNQLGSASETEWFTIASGGSVYSYIQVY
ncbi:hypothetical protein [Chryseobacterium echinoideorum]|uniref:hypothetical protein n=1 Tax=Chryseobacterium echinoideorum TaxID=1549648 RepID=UPI0011867F85|nr:hypothetical protein [Chryseobacterium echinoideorum]